MKAKLLIPSQYRSSFVPTVKVFYDNLVECLEHSPDISLSVYENAREFHNDVADEEITYHTKNKDSVNVKIGYLPDHFYIDRSGFSGWSTLANGNWTPLYSDEKANERFNVISDHYINNNISKYKQNDSTQGKKLESGYVSIFTQIPTDIVSHFMPVRWDVFLKSLVEEILKANPLEKIVIKRHPRCSDKRMSRTIYDIQNRYGKNVKMTDASIHQCISQSRAVFVGNSGVGFEALLHLKPVFSFAHSDYHHATINTTLDNVGNYENQIDAFDEAFRQKIRHFVTYYLDSYMATYEPDRIARRLNDIGFFDTKK